MGDHFDHAQTSTLLDTAVPALSALLEHPDFQRGFVQAQEEFLGSYQAAPLTEEQMIDEVERNLSRHATERDAKISQVFGCPPSSYFYNLGCVMGTIDQGLTYAR